MDRSRRTDSPQDARRRSALDVRPRQDGGWIAMAIAMSVACTGKIIGDDTNEKLAFRGVMLDQRQPGSRRGPKLMSAHPHGSGVVHEVVYAPVSEPPAIFQNTPL